MRRTTLILAALLTVWFGPARADPPVDLALVLLTDVSQSMDPGEYDMVKAGYRAAFADPEVAAAIIGAGGNVAVAYVEFSGKNEFALVKGWSLLTDAASARAFGEAVGAASRTSAGDTALAISIGRAADMLRAGEFGAARRVIDVVSDHPFDFGRAGPVRDTVVADGITINAIPIINDDPIGTIDGRLTYSGYHTAGGAAEFYRRDVMGGYGSFVIEARDHEAFGDALKRKLLREIVASN